MREDLGKLRGGKVANADHLNALHGDLGTRLATGADGSAIEGEDVFAPVLPAHAESATTQLDAGGACGGADLALAVLPRDDRGVRGGLEGADVGHEGSVKGG